MKIERTLFWFKDGDDMLISLNEEFFGLANLLNRLLNDKYNGVKIKFINIDFSTDKTYSLHTSLPKNAPYYFGGHLRYYGSFDRECFVKLTKSEQEKFIWENAYQYLIESAKTIKNIELKEASDQAFAEGLKIDLNPDYRVIDTDITVFSEELLRASVWINFEEDGMYSKLTLERSGKVIFIKELDKTKKGVEFFLEMYKSLELEGNNLVLRGSKDVDYLPLKISLLEIPSVRSLEP